LLVNILKNLHDYNNIVVTLDGLNEFGDELQCDRYYSLNLKSYYLFWTAIPRLRKIIREHNADIVHSHLYFSTLLARMATPKNVALVSTIHASVSESIEYKKSVIRFADQWTYKKRPGVLIGVSKNTIDDYFSYLKLKKGEYHVLYNFIDTALFNASTKHRERQGELKMIAVGSLKIQKNHTFLIQAMKKLKGQPVRIDIYGSGALEKELQAQIDENAVAVRLMGQVTNIAHVIDDYDVFVLSSLYEGFSLAVLEAMAMSKPMLLSDVTTFREQCADSAWYFSLDGYDDFANKVKMLKDDDTELERLAKLGKERLLQNFMPEHHMSGLRKIYMRVLEQKVKS
jgi:glycosyltransferase involved in cell wall biosynthesis